MSVHETAIARMRIAAGLGETAPGRTTVALTSAEAAEVVKHVEDLRELIGLAFIEAYGLGWRGPESGIDAWNGSGTRRVLRGWNTSVELAEDLRRLLNRR